MMRQRDEKVTMLGRELDILMRERQTLLQVVGATAALIASSTAASANGRCKSADLVATHDQCLAGRNLARCACRGKRRDRGGRECCQH
jgi:hypothetical protein